ncbi:RNA polymerase sigma factor SigY [Paenibacillus koleovorans]|uniref:RNA polymerase sigma factor SigY n=1 Tax=Paenibacillus koleovorans TaxID=121608 RepID=UPI000FDC5123|nr:RNA polymerase sigma factor SigY [Paenibacillus koleovorans]
MNNQTDLIRQAQRGDVRALAQLLREQYAILYQYLLKITLHPPTAEDLTQETMMKAVEKIRLYDSRKSKLSSWLITIATRLYLDQLRRRRLEREWMEQQSAESRRIQWQGRQWGEDWSELMDALAVLTQEMRVPIILKHYYGYPYEEIAQMLDIPLGTVKSRIHNGVRLLRKERLVREE